MSSGKKRFGFVLVLMFSIFSIAVASATCNLDVNLINQDPYPAMPGETVKLVFQITGVENIDCGSVSFKVMEEFPFSVDPSIPAESSIQSGIYIRTYQSFWLVPVILRIDKNAKEGANPVEILLTRSGGGSGILYSFDIEVEDVATDFEISVRDYSKAKGILTLEILNIGQNDVEALSIEIPEQDNLLVKGSNRNTLGILDSNEYTTTTFEAIVEKGELEFILRYNDLTGNRRIAFESVNFDPQPFLIKDSENGKISTTTIVIILFLIGIIAYWFYKRHKKRKHLKKEHK